jgi:hypothetical protein
MAVLEREPRTVKDTSELDPRFTEYHRTGQRVEVTYDDGEVERFYVGISTGWRPIYLKIKTTRSFGGDAIGRYERDRIVSIRGLAKYR